MEKKFKLGVIGAGFMSSAIVNGIINANILNSSEILVSDVSDIALEKMSNMGADTTTDNKFLANSCEFVLFAIKPQNSEQVFAQIKDCSCEKFISIMAGVKIDKISKSLNKTKIARCMPNTPCSIGCGAVGIDLTRYNCEKDISFIKSLFSAIGQVIEVEEKLLNAVTGISGSSPAYFYLFLKGIIDAGIEQGLDEHTARVLATNTMLGSAKMVLHNNDKSLEQLINAVCSKGGTTIEAINTYEKSGLTSITSNAVDACVKRAKELESL